MVEDPVEEDHVGRAVSKGGEMLAVKLGAIGSHRAHIEARPIYTGLRKVPAHRISHGTVAAAHVDDA